MSSIPNKTLATRRSLLAAALALPASAAAASDAGDDEPEFLFVQTAHSMAFSAHQNRLTLNAISPVTVFFSDRPDRIAGNMTTERFVSLWSEGDDSFRAVPPNADLSILEKGELRQVIVVLRDPVLEDGALHYTTEILEGVMPVEGENVSVFIDVIGMPATPVSFAGRRRRFRRRAIIR